MSKFLLIPLMRNVNEDCMSSLMLMFLQGPYIDSVFLDGLDNVAPGSTKFAITAKSQAYIYITGTLLRLRQLRVSCK